MNRLKELINVENTPNYLYLIFSDIQTSQACFQGFYFTPGHAADALKEIEENAKKASTFGATYIPSKARCFKVDIIGELKL